MKIKNQQWLQIKTADRTLYGFDQEWFGSAIKRASGCGPTAAAMLLSYLNRRDNGPLPYQNHDIEAAAKILEDVWKFVTPGFLGLHRVAKFIEGNKSLFNFYGAPWVCHELEVKRKDPINRIANFLNSGLKSDCPIAFLNLHAGKVSAFESWHWIVLVAIEMKGGRFVATGFDGGKRIRFDLNKWVESTLFGGGFVYLTK